MLIKNRFIAKAVSRFFEGESDTGNNNPSPNAGQNQGGQQNAAGSGNLPPNTSSNPTNQNQGSKTYSEKEFNEILNRRLAEDRRKLEDKNRQTVQELTALRESANLTETQKTQLQTRIDELESTYRTAEEQKKIELSKWEEKYNRDIKIASTERDSWHSRHDSLMISVDINRSAIKYDAFDPEQVEAILRPLTQVVEEKDSKGNGLGHFAPKVKFPSKDAEGKPVVLDLTVEAAVKAMHDNPDKYGNLFRSKATGGLNGSPNPAGGGNGRLPDIENMSVEEYKKNRAKIRDAVRQGQ